MHSPARRFACGLERARDVVVDRLAALGARALEVAPARVARARQHEEAGVRGLGRLEEGLEGVEAEPGVHGEAVGAERRVLRQIGGRVAGRRAPDVAALGVEHDEQTGGARRLHHLGQHLHAAPAERLEERALRLHRGDATRDALEVGAAEGAHRVRGVGRRGRHRAAPERPRNQRRIGIEPGAEGMAELAGAGDQPVGEG